MARNRTPADKSYKKDPQYKALLRKAKKLGYKPYWAKYVYDARKAKEPRGTYDLKKKYGDLNKQFETAMDNDD